MLRSKTRQVFPLVRRCRKIAHGWWNATRWRAGLGFVLAACALMLAPLTGCDKYTSDKEIEFISLADVSEYVTASKEKPMTMLLIDPRSQTAFEEGHIPGARNLLLTRFDGEKGRDPRIEAYDRVVVYGEDPASGVGRAVTKRMIAMSYSDVYFFAGGLKEWQGANLPLETGPSKPLPAVKGGNKRGRAR